VLAIQKAVYEIRTFKNGWAEENFSAFFFKKSSVCIIIMEISD
jgi:hypothetical protein